MLRAVFGLVLAVVLTSALAPVAAAPPDQKFVFDGKAMGTTVSVWFWTDDETRAAKAAADVFAEMKRLDLEMSNWVPESDVSKINAAAGGKPVVVSAETFAVIERAVEISRKSRGIFDITVGVLHGLWKFDHQNKDDTIPDPKAIKERLALVGWKDLVLDRKARTVALRRKGMAISLGGIAKGYAVDRCVKLLHDQGFVDFMVQAGGDMFVSGKKGATPWVVGIRDPRGPHDAMFAVMPIEDHAFSTSGDYERTFMKAGVRYHHIIDLRTGQPATASRSVTIRAKDAFTADAWSKVMFILGPTEAMKLIAKEKLADFEVVWVDAKNEVKLTKGVEKTLQQLKKPTPGP
ncbi:MAG: FAD:protein FMN transferase [Deltaproteobacteria bacterium]|nr:FAD:protein FMN transferase [Deltaproteobacteria bacterium]